LFIYGNITSQPGLYWMMFVDIISSVYLVFCQVEKAGYVTRSPC
jgi:hypothetical protein